MEDLPKFQSITKNLQLKGILPHDVWYVFSGVVLNYPVMNQCIHLDYDIANNPSFESGLVNILNKEISSMPRLKKIATIGPKAITGGVYTSGLWHCEQSKFWEWISEYPEQGNF